MGFHSLRKLPAAMEAEEAAGKANNGAVPSVNTYGNGSQIHTGTKFNTGAYAGDGNSHHTYNNHGEKAINNGGTFNGHGNGGFISGNLLCWFWFALFLALGIVAFGYSFVKPK